jgi:hypothetical protein
MKKTHLLAICFSLILPFTASAQNEEREVSEWSDYDDVSLIDQVKPKEYTAIPSKDLANIQFDDVRPLSEINIDNVSEAYPWISPDGLRLYFTQNLEGGKDQLYWVSRKDIRDKFGDKKKVAFEYAAEDLSDSRFSAWLTNDELDIYYISREDGDLYHASRNNMNMSFGKERKVELNGNVSGFKSAPSLTADGNRLYMYNSDGTRKILIFKNDGNDVFSLVDEIVPNFEIGPSQLAKDEEKFLLGLGSNWTHDCSLYFMGKEEGSPEFNKVTYIQSHQNDSMLLRIAQPTLTQNEKIMVFVGGASDTWEDNQLYIATSFSKLSSVVSDALDSKNFTISEPTPNPAKDLTTVEFTLPQKESENSYIQLTNSLGQELKRFAVTSEQKNIQMSVAGLAEGIYIYKLITPIRASEGHRLVVSKNQ